MRIDMEFHALADAFPLMQGAEFRDLVASILMRGQLTRIITFEGKILDGRNRYRACKEAGVEPVCEDFEGTFEEARDHVIDANLRRRHLDASQRAMVGARLATLERGDNQHAPIGATSQDLAANMLNVGRRSVQRAREVIDDGVPELVEAVERGEVSVSRAAKIASLPREEQAARITEPKYDVASPPDLPPPSEIERIAEAKSRPLRNLEYLAAGELARWIKITTPDDRPRVIRMLRECAAILEAEIERADG
jgi:hypothetical protein